MPGPVESPSRCVIRGAASMNAAIKHGIILAAVVAGIGGVAAGCLTRPVVAGNPLTSTQVAIVVPNQVINKIDMLFDIDNSASMGDKQVYLIQAIPDLIDGLVNPNCIDNATGAVAGKSMQGTGCAQATIPSRRRRPLAGSMRTWTTMRTSSVGL